MPRSRGGDCTTEPATHPGGNGATVTGTLAVTPGQTLQIAVGGAGHTKGCAGASDSAGGWGNPDGFSPGGAGLTGYTGTEVPSGGGGGATDVSLDGGFVLSAGGGGGGGAGSSDHNGGLLTGVTVATPTGSGDGSVTLTWQP